MHPLSLHDLKQEAAILQTSSRLRHMEALHLAARRHGFANWNAARGALGEGLPPRGSAPWTALHDSLWPLLTLRTQAMTPPALRRAITFLLDAGLAQQSAEEAGVVWGEHVTGDAVQVLRVAPGGPDLRPQDEQVRRLWNAARTQLETAWAREGQARTREAFTRQALRQAAARLLRGDLGPPVADGTVFCRLLASGLRGFFTAQDTLGLTPGEERDRLQAACLAVGLDQLLSGGWEHWPWQITHRGLAFVQEIDARLCWASYRRWLGQSDPRKADTTLASFCWGLADTAWEAFRLALAGHIVPRTDFHLKDTLAQINALSRQKAYLLDSVPPLWENRGRLIREADERDMALVSGQMYALIDLLEESAQTTRASLLRTLAQREARLPLLPEPREEPWPLPRRASVPATYFLRDRLWLSRMRGALIALTPGQGS